jgi:hypothetical protein
VMSFSVALKSGQTALVNPFGQGTTIYPNGKPAVPPPIVIGLVRATLDKPMTAVGNDAVTTTAAVSDVQPTNGSAHNPDLKPLTIQLTVVEVNEAKLKRLGFEWTQLSPEDPQQFSVDSIAPLRNGQRMSADQLNGFLRSLQQSGLARVLAEPTLITLDGRPAVFNSGPTSVEFVPSLLDDGRVKLTCRLKTGDSLDVTADDELNLGKLCLVRNARIRRPGQSPGTEMLFLARVDLLKSGEIPNIAGPPTYIEVAGKSK